MQMETVLVFAAATGRTLVLPPDQPMYLLDQGKGTRPSALNVSLSEPCLFSHAYVYAFMLCVMSGHQKAHSFADFFPFDLISEVVPVIPMKAFMQAEAVTGHLRHNIKGDITYPPNNKTEFEGTNREDRLAMWEYLRNVTNCPTWEPMTDFVILPPRPGVNVSLGPGMSVHMEE
jgi:hypothetical protein